MSDKTERPTPRRLQRARKEGDIARSASLSTALSGALWWLMLVFQAPALFAGFVRMTEAVLEVDMNRPFAWQLKAVLGAAFEPGKTALIMLGFGVLAATVPELAQTRGLVAFARIAPDFSRLNPIEGLRNLISLKACFETGLVTIQLAILSYVAWQSISAWLAQIAPAYALAPMSQLAFAAHAHSRLIALAVFTQLAPAAADYAIQRVLRVRRLRMDHAEIRREQRDEHGDPYAKGRRRAFHQEINQP